MLSVLKLNFSSVFNSALCDVMLASDHEDLPALYDFIHLCYTSLSLLRFGDFLLSLFEVVQQGCNACNA